MRSAAERIRSGHREVRRIGKLESTHRIKPDDPDPVRQQGILAAIRRQTAPIGVGNDFRAKPAKDDRAEMVIGMVVGQDEPLDGLIGNSANPSGQRFAIAGAGQGIDHDHTIAGHDEAGIGPSFRAAAGVAEYGVHSIGESVQRKRARFRDLTVYDRSRRRGAGEDQGKEDGAGEKHGTGADGPPHAIEPRVRIRLTRR
jgi:hypothetical protein